MAYVILRMFRYLKVSRMALETSNKSKSSKKSTNGYIIKTLTYKKKRFYLMLKSMIIWIYAPESNKNLKKN